MDGRRVRSVLLLCLDARCCVCNPKNRRGTRKGTGTDRGGGETGSFHSVNNGHAGRCWAFGSCAQIPGSIGVICWDDRGATGGVSIDRNDGQFRNHYG